MENDEDRLEEKRKFDERANEDSYFAMKEHELIEGMKAEFQRVEAARREGQVVNCPKCPGKLERYKFMDFVLDRCESCEGIWLDKSGLKGILRKAARGPLGAFLDRCFAKDETGKKSHV
ncbi:MAG TPA: zf-TFIIB domain-containing protein [Candidatus Binatia bacterium]|nr:zf-TFIIB domain-containing protein [Candidatus Binatia bacterium]